MSQSMLNIIKGALGLIIPEEWRVLLEETHITVHFLCEIAHKTAKKVCLPLQTLEFKEISWGLVEPKWLQFLEDQSGYHL